MAKRIDEENPGLGQALELGADLGRSVLRPYRIGDAVKMAMLRIAWEVWPAA